ncbi:MAG: methyltransferase domain-containing protein [Verrucomicrobiaceae bacterium]|nr:methyltransferase domain-containing protein [Verrucomicrobiaceae bacterium]
MSARSFLRESCRNWKTVGAVAPSSQNLADLMMKSCAIRDARKILELGPGTGAFTQAISEFMSADARYLGLEVNEAFVQQLRTRFPAMRFEHAGAQEFDLGAAEFAGGFDAVISGLPWAAFPEGLQRAILGNVLPHLAPNGLFVTFAYYGFHQLPAGRHFRELLESLLPDVHMTEIVWGNVPPAFVYVGRKQSA